MRAVTAGAIGLAMLLVQGCPSAYQRTYDRETQRLEAEQRAAETQAIAEHAEASRYAAVVYFDVGSSVIGPDGQRELRWFLGKMQPYPEAVFLVQGFADATGTEAGNRSLSEDRARVVTEFLSAEGIAPARLVTQGFGTESPAASNLTAGGRRNNRRVEVTVR
jgi:outer membrane protein OmpA-like peptidoglycan-associated protein